MFKPENKIIIVDDIQAHLDTLSQPFKDNGIGCTCFKYDVAFNSPLNTVRIAFFDIYINPSGSGSESQRKNDIATAIQQYISKDNGPYILIFWTSNKDKIEGIKKYINERFPDCPKPFLVDCIDKDVFLNNPNRLAKKVQKMLNNETLKMLFSFEDTAAKAASKTINQLFNIIPGTDTWGITKSFQKNFEKVFSKIAVQNIGYKHAQADPDRGVISTLLPVLNHHLETSQETGQWKTYLKTLAKATTPQKVKYPASFNEGQLNSIFHIYHQEDIPKDERGVVIKIDSGAIFQTNFGLQYSEWFSALLNGVSTAHRNASKLIAVEISSSCDYSQKKKRINKYMLGVLLPVEAAKTIKKDRKPEYQFILDGVFSTDSKFKICLNLNFVFSALETDNRLQDSIFILKKEIMDQIGNRYANHISRIGITSF